MAKAVVAAIEKAKPNYIPLARQANGLAVGVIGRACLQVRTMAVSSKTRRNFDASYSYLISDDRTRLPSRSWGFLPGQAWRAAS